MPRKRLSRGRRPGAGTRVLDRQFPGIGRIQVRSGTHDRAIYDQLNQMLTALWDYRRLDVLAAIRDGTAGPLDVLAAYRERGAADLRLRQRTIPLMETFERWIGGSGLRPTTVRGYRVALRPLFASAAHTTTVDALPGLLGAYKERVRARGVGARTFNHARAAALSFAKSVLGRRDEVYTAIHLDCPPLRHRTALTTGIPVARAREIAEALGPREGAMWWTLCTTGMRPFEYFVDSGWTVDGECVRIHGTKTAGAARVVPLTHPVVQPGVQYRAFIVALHRVAPDVTPRTARKSYAAWMELASIARTRRRRYLGHARRDVTDIYEDSPVEPFLADDRKALRRVLGAVPAWLQKLA